MTTVARETYSPNQAFERAREWCVKHPAWMRICDLPDGYCDTLYVPFDELSVSKQRYFETAENYREWGHPRCKVKSGFVSGKGEFYDDILSVPGHHNFMMVFRIGAKAANEIQAKKEAEENERKQAKHRPLNG